MACTFGRPELTAEVEGRDAPVWRMTTLTGAYPHEAPIGDLLIERVAEASKNIRAFRIRLGGLG